MADAHAKPNNSRFKDIEGQRFGKLTVGAYLGRNANGKPIWAVVCDCGSAKEICGHDLTSGNTRSCGCALTEMLVARNQSLKTHGMKDSPEWRAWHCMKCRCLNSRNAAFPRYGGRGITVCKEWQESFIKFFSHVGPRPTPQHSLDRIDNNGNYEPGNVRWATWLEQNNNRCTTRKIEVRGEAISIAEVARRYQIPETTLHRLLFQQHWTIDQVLARYQPSKG